MSRSRLTRNEKNLIRRYLVWCYKTTKEDLDKIDRYFTQSKADHAILGCLRKTKEYKSSTGDKAYKDLVDQFEVYMESKESNVLKKKFKDKKCREPKPEHTYLRSRYLAIEQAICYFLGEEELEKICCLYEEEMTRRILEAREHT